MSSKAPAKRKRPPAKKRPIRKKALSHGNILVFLLSVCGLVSLSLGFALAWFISLDIPDIRSTNDYSPQVATTILDRHGEPLDAIYNQYRVVIPYAAMHPLLPKAFVAAEDSRYWDHAGLDLWSILRAAINNLRSGRRSQGGSTITQQVTRSLMLSREKTYFRKITEAILAYRLDKMLTKEEILYLYLNEIYLGEGAYGVEAASRVYFDKKASQLSLAEIAVLAGLPQAPSRYSPIKHPKPAKARQRYVLNRMAEDGIIKAATARKAFAQPLHYLRSGEKKSTNGYFAQFVRSQLKRHYGKQALYHQGLTVTTTLDKKMQLSAAAAINKGVNNLAKRQQSKTKAQGAMVVLETKSGEIRAMVGGTGYNTSQYNRAALANRQPGSVFKPIIFAAAFEKGLRPQTRIDDRPFSIKNTNGKVWSPKNYDNKYHGPTTLAEALIHSRNIVAIKLLQQIGIRPVLKLASKAGITAPLEPDLTLALGASPVSLVEMTASYTTFANDGKCLLPTAITKVRDAKGKVTIWPGTGAKQIIRASTATTMNSLLSQVITKGTGKKAAGIQKSSGKTGTSDRNMDAWFIGYTPKLTTGVWLGHDKNRSLGKGETGGTAAAPVWKDFMLQYH